MSGCDHIICKTPESEGLMTVSSYKAYIRDSQSFQSILYSREVPTKDFIDGRKGYCDKFNYCPWCGDKINWKEVGRLLEWI